MRDLRSDRCGIDAATDAGSAVEVAQQDVHGAPQRELVWQFSHGRLECAVDLCGALRGVADGLIGWQLQADRESVGVMGEVIGPDAHAHYQQRRSQGKRHNAAVSCVARRRCNIILAMLKTQTRSQPPPLRRLPQAAEKRLTTRQGHLPTPRRTKGSAVGDPPAPDINPQMEQPTRLKIVLGSAPAGSLSASLQMGQPTRRAPHQKTFARLPMVLVRCA